MKLSVFTVCTPDFTPEQLIAEAKEAGIDGIEWRFADVPQEAFQEEPSFWRNNRCSISLASDKTDWFKYRRAAEEGGLASVAVIPNMAAGDLETTERLLQAASFMEAPLIRLGVPVYDGSRPYCILLEEARTYLKQAEGLCRDYGVKGIIETHHQTLASSASGALHLCQGLNPAHIGVLYDPGNLMYEGYEQYRMGLELLGPYLAHVHVKNVGLQPESGPVGPAVRPGFGWSGLRDGLVPWEQVIADLRSVGYGGYLGLEDYSGQYASGELLREFAAYIGPLAAAGR